MMRSVVLSLLLVAAAVALPTKVKKEILSSTLFIGLDVESLPGGT